MSDKALRIPVLTSELTSVDTWNHQPEDVVRDHLLYRYFLSVRLFRDPMSDITRKRSRREVQRTLEDLMLPSQCSCY